MLEFWELSFIVRVTGFVLGIGLAISTLEYISNIRQCGPEGLFSWAVWRETQVRNSPVVRKFTDPIFNSNGVLVVLLTRLPLIAALIHAAWEGDLLNPALLSALILTQLYVNFRFPVGKDGSDQMSSIVLTMLFIISWFPENRVIVNACVVFIAFQSVVSYMTAGIAKLISPQWRSGDVILQIVSTETYGCRSMARTLNDHVFFRRALNYGTMAFELSILLVFFLPHPFNAAFLLVPLAFHAGCAWSMGLNVFVFAFAAALPSVLYVSNQIHYLLRTLERCL
jgi:hypothetical protein